MSLVLSLGALLMSASSPEASVTAKVDDPIICTGRGDSVVGTRMRPKKICMRKSDWDYQKKNTQRELQQINNRGNNPGPALGRADAPQ